MMLYVVRRHLGFSRAEWEALPWHDQLMYLEGLQDEFYDPEQEEEDATTTEAVVRLGAQVRQVEAPAE